MIIVLCMHAQLYLILCNPMHCNPPGSSVHGVLQARILQRVVIPSPEDLPNLGVKPRSPALQQTLYHLSHQRSP